MAIKVERINDLFRTYSDNPDKTLLQVFDNSNKEDVRSLNRTYIEAIDISVNNKPRYEYEEIDKPVEVINDEEDSGL